MSILTHLVLFRSFLISFMLSYVCIQPLKELVSPPRHLCRILQQLRKDHAGVQTPDRRRFATIEDSLQRLLPYHVFQGTPPSQDEFSQGTASNSLPLP